MLKVRLSKSSELNEDVVQAHKLKSSFCLRHVLKDMKKFPNALFLRRCLMDVGIRNVMADESEIIIKNL